MSICKHGFVRLMTPGFLFLSFLPFSANALILSEVYYDPTGADDGFEWVELFNPGSIAINLSGYSLGNGGADYTSSTVTLSGVIGSGDYFVIGGPTVSGGVIPDQSVNFSPDFQNSGTTADGVALLFGSDIIDAVIYGELNSNGLFDETGAIGLVDVADAPSGSSIERINLAGDWQIQSAPTPGSGLLPLMPTVTDKLLFTVPEPGVLYLFCIGAMIAVTMSRLGNKARRIVTT